MIRAGLIVSTPQALQLGRRPASYSGGPFFWVRSAGCLPRDWVCREKLSV